MRKIFPFELFHLGGDEVHTGQYEWFSSCISPNNNLILKLKLLKVDLYSRKTPHVFSMNLTYFTCYTFFNISN